MPNLRRRYEEGTWLEQENLEPYRALRPCPTCSGERLKAQSRAVRVKGRTISEYVDLPISEAVRVFDALELTDRETLIASRILREIRDRLHFLNDVGVGYLTLGRSAATLSGGEGQRIRLATQIGSNLTGVLYVLDEPSIGLHQRDNRALLSTLARLRDLGNTVVVVEHDEETIRTADYVVDLGPGAGEHGGHVIFQGTPAELLTDGNGSLTGAYLRGERTIETPASRRAADARRDSSIKGARENNLKDIDVALPLGVLTTVTGVSGSGKSTLVNEILYRALARDALSRRRRAGRAHVDRRHRAASTRSSRSISRRSAARRARTRRPTPGSSRSSASSSRCCPTPRRAASGPGASRSTSRADAARPARATASSRSRCTSCPNVYVTCEQCKGRRYNRETLEIKYRGKSIADVLDLTVDQALPLLENFPPIANKLRTLQDVGLGYIELGQSATTLSGGEAQRVKLAKELSRRGTGRTLYILDEPTTGLHFEDTHKLLDVLNKLVDQGNTVVIIEHNLDVIKSADYVIDLGPEGGEGGGRIVAQGTPEVVATSRESFTGRFLADILGAASATPVARSLRRA